MKMKLILSVVSGASAICLSLPSLAKTSSSDMQVRVNCQLLGTNAWVEAVKDDGGNPSVILYNKTKSGTKTVDFRTVDILRGSSSSLYVEASAFKWSLISIESDLAKYGGDLSNPEESYWNGKLELTFQAVKDAGLTREKYRVRCSHEI